MTFFGELKRRNVFRIAVAYVVTSWLLVQVADTVLESIGAPDWTMRALLSLLALGFLPALIFAWAFEITPEGIKPESEVDRSASIAHHTGRKLDITIIVMLICIGSFVVWDSQRSGQPGEEGAATADVSAVQSPVSETHALQPAGDKSIAVLPFVNLSSDPEQEYFSDGISEELLNVLAQIPELRVAARTSSFQFKGDNRDISEIAQLLKVNHVLEGSVRKAGTRLRVTAQLIEAENGYHLWSDTYDRELNDVFAIQDEISAAIGDALKAELGLSSTSATAAPRVAETANTAAYEAYLKGRYLVNQRGNRAIAEAVRELEKSIRLDPNFAPAQAQLAIAIALSNNSSSSYGDLTVAEVNSRAVPHAEAAMALNPDLAEAWGAKSIIASTNSDYEAAIAYAEKALELNPIYTDAMNWIQTSALLIGRYQEGTAAAQQLLEIDPLSVVGRVNMFSNYFSKTDPDRARIGARELIEQHKWAGYTALGNVASREGKVAESLYWLLQAYAFDPLDRFSNQGMVLDLCRLNLAREAQRISDVTLVSAEANCGDLDRALQLLERLIMLDPDDPGLVEYKAELLYWNDQPGLALAMLREITEELGSQPIVSGGYGLRTHLHYVWLLQQSGNVAEAEKELLKIDRDLAAREGTPMDIYAHVTWDRGLRALLDGDRARALEYFRQAVQDGMRDWQDFEDPMVAGLAADAEFQAIRSELDSLLDEERDKALVMMCIENPVPESWQPLAETCDGVTAPPRRG